VGVIVQRGTAAEALTELDIGIIAMILREAIAP
jgi:hypothetical protein